QMTLDILLKEMQITPDQQFRLIGVGVYALSTQEPLPQLSLWSD
ncbi:MAG: DNA polymerase IV, partial [Acinetobacter sp.]